MRRFHCRLPYRLRILALVALVAFLATPITLVVPNAWAFAIVFFALISGFTAIWKLSRSNRASDRPDCSSTSPSAAGRATS